MALSLARCRGTCSSVYLKFIFHTSFFLFYLHILHYIEYLFLHFNYTLYIYIFYSTAIVRALSPAWLWHGTAQFCSHFER